jgi:hypothetical protein
MNIKTLLCLSLSIVSTNVTIASTYVYAEQQGAVADTAQGTTQEAAQSAAQGVSQGTTQGTTQQAVQETISTAIPIAVQTAAESTPVEVPAPSAQQQPASIESIPDTTSVMVPPAVETPGGASEHGVPAATAAESGQTANSAAQAESAPDHSTLAALKGKQAHRAKKNNELDEMELALPDESESAPRSNKVVALEGSATYFDISARFGERLHKLTKSALDQNPEYQKTAKAVDHYRTNVQRALRVTKDAVNYVYPYRGFSMSIEGSRVILDEKQKLNNLCVAELTKQRYWDEMHPKVMAQILQITQGLGMENSDDADAAVKKGVAGLANLTDAETAEATLKELKEWKNQLSVPEPLFNQPSWDVESSERVYQNAIKVSADGDPLIHQVFKTVKKYEHGKLANMAAGAIEANLSAVTILSGNPFASLAAEGVNTAFVMTTGGPEENKILKELYFGRRLEIRRKRISDEAQLALTNYQKALMTHNAPQLAMSEMVLSELVGPERIATVLEHDPVNDIAMAPPIELAKKDTP